MVTHQAIRLSKLAPTHRLHHPELAQRQRPVPRLITASSPGVFIAPQMARRSHSAMVSGEFRDPNCIPRRAWSMQYVAVLVARLGGGKRRQGERRHAKFHNDWYWEFRPGVPRGGRRYRSTARLSGTDRICQHYRSGRRASRCSAAGCWLRAGVGRRCASC